MPRTPFDASERIDEKGERGSARRERAGTALRGETRTVRRYEFVTGLLNQSAVASSTTRGICDRLIAIRVPSLRITLGDPAEDRTSATRSRLTIADR